MGLLTNNSSGGGPFYPSEISSTNLKIASVTFAALPSAATSTGKIYLVSDAGPAPGMYMVSNGTIWRPFGGRQVLAQRSINPVTVQNLSGEVAETIGPFPGGLVRAGMQLQMLCATEHSGIGSSGREFFAQINGTNWFNSGGLTASGAALFGRHFGTLDVVADTSAAHKRLTANPASYAYSLLLNTITIDFSQPWSPRILLISAAETAVAISTATWVGGVATYNTSAASTLAVGDKTTIAGVDLAGYNGVFIVASVVDTDTFTVAMASDPGGSGTGGTSSRISNMKSQSYVLELVG